MKSRCESQNETLVTRVETAERNILLLAPEYERKLSDSLSPLGDRLSICEQHLEQLRSLFPVSAATPIPRPVSTPGAVPPVSLAKLLKETPCPLPSANSLDGIISYLTRKHGGNVHDSAIVTLTSKSVLSDDARYAVRNLADLASQAGFYSKDEPNQWVCWDFHEMRVRPTHYTIKSARLKSWVIESSLDGVNWAEMDRKTNTTDLKSPRLGSNAVASFALSNPTEFRFIRLTQTGKSHNATDGLVFLAFEVFGTLLE
jgi:hypothetical protein